MRNFTTKYAKLSLLIITALLLVATYYHYKPNSFVELDLLFGEPEIIKPTLSPDGKYIAYISARNNASTLYVAPIENISKAAAVSHHLQKDVKAYQWTFKEGVLIYSIDDFGKENFQLFVANIKTGTEKSISLKDGARSSILKISPKLPGKVLLSIITKGSHYEDIYTLNLDTDELQLLYKNKNLSDFIADNNLNLIFAEHINGESGDSKIFDISGDTPKAIGTIPFEDTATTRILEFSQDNKVFYMLDSRDRDTAALYEVNRNGQRRLLAEGYNSDISNVIFDSNYNYKGYYENFLQTKTVSFEEPNLKELISKTLSISNFEFIIESRTLDDNKWLLNIKQDIMPDTFYLFDRITREIRFLFSFDSKLANHAASLSKMEPIIIKSRDGYDLIAYITLPKKYELAQKMAAPLPMVLVVHGGPFSRDSWGYRPTHQWLANRGYAVLSVNYRGSKGFGKKLLNAGNGEWAGRAHDDLIDAVNWAILKGIADQHKIAIMGGSYGGYATLLGMTITPDVFACGVSYAGISNLKTFLENSPSYWKPFIISYYKKIGATPFSKNGLAILAEKSPITYINNIKNPLFIAHGANDPRTTIVEAEQMVSELKAKGIAGSYLLFKNEGHGYSKSVNRLFFYDQAEQFLDSCLGSNSYHGKKLDLPDQAFLEKF